MDFWIGALTANRIVIYTCCCLSLGTTFWLGILVNQSRFYSLFKKTIVVSCLIGAFASILSIAIQTGSFASAGLLGMFDPSFFSIIWSTGNGSASKFLLAGFITLLTAQFVIYFLQDKTSRTALWLLSLIATVLFALSFTVNGHFVNSPTYNHFVLSLHVITVILWLGSLFPLYVINQKADLVLCKKIMLRFSRVATVVVVILISCGLWLSYQIVDGFMALFNSPYGNTLLIKIFIVSTMLGIAATNKLYWVPKLDQKRYHQGLSRFIVFEIIVGITILSVTGIMTTVVGID